ncbi:hypothetical protein [Phenylobacterium sp.]|jgi:hypothetical protein|uniref:hypothetical protein n=1 Tax=Phenylobacterium sp. TaxID=1871053 RepID=UPI002E333FBA|nr:hypothetical protein [Phenylobacterium sp.]HEX3367731.1 hypothetical protein [Phenylobacterium sp.]
MRIGLLSLIMLALAAPTAWAQPADAPQAVTPPVHVRDPIGALLNPNAPPSRDEDEPDTAGQPRTAPEPEPGLLPTGPQPKVYVPAPRPQLDAPVSIDDLSKTPDRPPEVRDLAYDARIRSSFASAQSFQGPLDGGWMLSADGQDLFALQLVDRRDRLEGVWRDVRRKGALNASGLVDDLQRQGGELTVRFAQPGAPATVATLHDAGDGQWRGELTEAGARHAVVLRRTGL